MYLSLFLIIHSSIQLGLAIYTLVPGRDICLTKNSITSPIQKRIHDFAIDMKNLIHLIVDIETRKCVVIDAVSIIYVCVYHLESVLCILLYYIIYISFL